MIYGILLAAGASSRMGRPKQLLDWRGEPLVRHVARQALASDLAGLAVVVGAAAAAVRAALAGLATDDGQTSPAVRHPPALAVVENTAYARGQAGSLRLGLQALPTAAAAAVVLLVDQPLITPALINMLIAAFPARRDPQSAVAVIPRYRGQRGNPALLARELFAELVGLEGDEGARGVLQRHAGHVRWLDIEDPAVVTDVDTWDEYERLR